MKTISPLILGSAIGLFAGLPAFAETKGQQAAEKEAAPDAIPEVIPQVIGNLDQITLSPEMKKAIIDALSESKGEPKPAAEVVPKPAAGPKDETKIGARTVVIGPDGKPKILSGDDLAGIDLNKILSCLGDGSGIQATGSFSMIGPDGKLTTRKLDLGNGGSLDKILKDVLKAFNPDGGGAAEELLSVGPGIVVDAAKTSADIKEIKEELAAQRVLLEKILTKLQ